MDQPTFKQRVSKAAVFLFGRWEPPVWAVAACRPLRRGGAWLVAHKRGGIPVAAILLGTLVGGYFGYRYYQSLPKPHTVEVSVWNPSPTPLKKDATPDSLALHFAEPVAPLSMINKEVKKGITLKPALPGRWVWKSEKELVFKPRHDWPVGVELEIELAKRGLVAKHVLLSTYELEGHTPSFIARIARSEFYQDPVAAEQKKVVTTFTFSHAVDDATFRQFVKLRLIPSDKQHAERDLGFTVTYDKLKGKAFVHSEPIPIPEKDAEALVTLEPGARAARGGPPFDKKLTDTVRVPGIRSHFRFTEIEPQVVDNERLEPEQILVVTASLGVSNTELDKAIQAWVLPLHNPEQKTKAPFRWANVEEVSDQLLAKSKRLQLEQLPSAKEYDSSHNFRFREAAGRYIYVRIREGMRSFGGYVLGDTYQQIVTAPSFPKTVKFLYSGSLLSLSGDHNVTVLARDVPGLHFRLARVIPEQLHHFVSQSSGNFGSPQFYEAIKPEHLADFHEETRAISSQPGKPVYEALSLSRYLNDGQQHRGLFLVTVKSWDPRSKETSSPADERLILVTDLGVFVKRAVDHSQEVFVQSFQSGRPVAGARVEVLGKNGLPVAAATTGPEGNAKLPALNTLKQEREPVVYVIHSGRDWSFLPFADRDRVLDISRFDVGGVTEASAGSELGAYVFSDRGIYRPGDTFNIGYIVRRQDWREAYKGLPLVATIVDPRGLEIKRVPLMLDAAGFGELSYKTQETSPTGKYTTSIYSARDGRPGGFLGATSVQVREFLPDTMRIKVSLNAEARAGWVHPEDLTAKVVVTNLYGTPSSGRRVRGMLRLRPGLPSLPNFSGYRFFDPLLTREAHEEKLDEQSTDENGEATFELELKQFYNATYLLSVEAEAFEGGGGRSVVDEAHVAVSPLKYLVGWKADGDLSYLHRGAQQNVQLVAVSPEGKAIAVSALSTVLLERKYLSVLTRQENGTYKYQSVAKEVELSRKPLAISAGGTTLALATQRPGEFAVVIRGAQGETWQRIQYAVAGSANLSRSMEKSSELQIVLNKSSITAGGTLQMEIKAPYTGSGLITVERDQVYAHKWFTTDTTATVQTIQVPRDLEIGGYVAVAFVRSATSDKVLINPLSHGVVPFTINRERRNIVLGLDSTPLGKPGQPYAIKVKANKPARAIVFAVDEGILRVAGYSTPDPLEHFLKKRSLGVRTAQLLDLILPGQQPGALAPGGDSEGNFLGANLNPFKRRRDKPAVYWSGIIDVGPTAKALSYTPPDSFNGTLRVMAVAAAPDVVGSTSKSTIIRGDFMITPNAPVAVAPGDSFEVSATVANNVEGSGKQAKTAVSLTVGEQLEVVGPKQQTLQIEEGREVSTIFQVRAREKLGAASLTFVAANSGKQSRRMVELSVRPASPFLTTLQTGYLRPGQKREIPVGRQLYTEYRTGTTGLSGIPLTLAHGLAAYLRSFPHPCTEQLSSQAVPAIVLGKTKDFGYDPKQTSESVSRFVEKIWSRQNADGSFGVWAANPHVSPQASVYTMHVLYEARERGYPVPEPLWKRGLKYLQKLAEDTPGKLSEARVRSWAIYLLTRDGMVTTSYATAAQAWLNANHARTWQQDLAGAYLAAAYKLLKKDDVAEQIMQQQRLGLKVKPDYADYYDDLARDSQLLYLLARHFPYRAAGLRHTDIDPVVAAIATASYNTFSSAFTIIALEALASLARETKPEAQLVVQKIGGQDVPLRLPDGLMPLAPFSPQATALLLRNPGPVGRYFLVSQQGFDTKPDSGTLSQGLEVFREYLDEKDQPVTTVKVGDQLKVRFLIRALGKPRSNLAIVDLLPAGFEVVVHPSTSDDSEHSENSSSEESNDNEGEDEGDDGNDSDEGNRRAGPAVGLPIAVAGTTFEPEYWDVREDRVVLYGSVDTQAQKYIYRVKATSVGKFVIPPVQGASLYDRQVMARGQAGVMTVTKAQ